MTEIKLYTSKTCYMCVAVKKWLEKNNVQFTELNAFEHEAYLMGFGIKTLPIIEIDGNVQKVESVDRLMELLKLG